MTHFYLLLFFILAFAKKYNCFEENSSYNSKQPAFGKKIAIRDKNNITRGYIQRVANKYNKYDLHNKFEGYYQKSNNNICSYNRYGVRSN